LSPPRSTNAAEVNFDGLVGPTHNYAGLSLGNRASMGNAGATSSPRRAALQGLAKMRSLINLGVPQGLLPPQIRPDPEILAFAKRMKLSIDYHSGEELERMTREIMATPKPIVDKVKKVLNIKG